MRPSQMRKAMDGPPPGQDPERTIPKVIIVLILLNVVIWLLRFVMPFGLHEEFLRYFSVVPGRMISASAADAGGTLHEMASFITHAFLHADLMHLGFNCIWLLAFGTLIASRFQAERLAGTVIFLSFYLSAAVFSAIVFVLLNIGQPVLLLGASGALSALFAGAARAGFNRRRFPDGQARPLLALGDRRIIGVTVVYGILNLVLATPLGPLLAGSKDADIAWQVHIAGFVYGLVVMPFFDRLAGNRLRFL